MKTFSFLITFLRGGVVPPEDLLKDITDLLYVNASHIRWRLTPEVLEELKAAFVAEILEIPKPVDDPLKWMHSRAKRHIYGSQVKEIPLDKIPPLFGVSQIEEIGLDILTPVTNSVLHPHIRRTYDLLVGQMSYGQAVSLAESQGFLGQMISAAIFRTISIHGLRPPSPLDEDEEYQGNCLNLSQREEEVLFGVVCAKLNKKWTPPAYILMRDTFFLALFSFMGEAMAPGLGDYFKNVYRSSRVFCHVSKLYRELEKMEAEKVCGARFKLRQRDVQNRHKHITRLLRRYDAFVGTYCRQLCTDAKRVGAVIEDDGFLSKLDGPSTISSGFGISDEDLGEGSIREGSAAGCGSGHEVGAVQDGGKTPSGLHGGPPEADGTGGHGEDDA